MFVSSLDGAIKDASKSEISIAAIPIPRALDVGRRSIADKKDLRQLNAQPITNQVENRGIRFHRANFKGEDHGVRSIWQDR
jgi:hypothetical protein